MVPMNITIKVILLNRYFSYVTNNLRLINDKFMFRGRTDPHILSQDPVQSLGLSLSLGLDQVSMRLARFFSSGNKMQGFNQAWAPIPLKLKGPFRRANKPEVPELMGR